MTYGWIWITLIVLAVVVEALTDQLISIWFVPGSVVAIVFDFFELDLVWQIFVILVLAAGGIVLARTLIKKNNQESNVKTNLDAIIGEKCVVTERIDNYAGCGQAKVRGQIWSARGVSEDSEFEVGEVLKIVAIEGVKLICKKD